MTNKKLGLLLFPLFPLTAIGIVEVASAIMPPAPVAIVETQPVQETPELRPAPSVQFARPVAPPPPAIHVAPQPTARG